MTSMMDSESGAPLPNRMENGYNLESIYKWGGVRILILFELASSPSAFSSRGRRGGTFCARVLRSQERRCSRLLRSKAPCLILDPRYHIWSGVPTLGSHTIPSLGGGSDSTAAKPCRAAWIPSPSKPLLFPAHTLLGLPILGPRLTSKSTKNSIRSSHRQGQNGMAFQYILSFVRAHTSRGCGKKPAVDT